MLETALYLRLSKEESEDDTSNKIENQWAVVKEYVEKQKEFHVAEVYCDNGKTGRSFDRLQWQRLIGDIEQGKINCVIVKDLSRLGRNYLEAGYYMEEFFPKKRVRFIALAEAYDSAKRMDMTTAFTYPLQNMANQFYSSDLSKKICEVRKIQRQKGVFTGSCVAYGYKRNPQQKGKLIIDEEKAAVVRRIFAWVMEDISYSEIVRRLHQQRVAAPRGKAWSTTTIQKMVTNTTYIGTLCQGKHSIEKDAVIWEDQHDALIEKAIFDAVQEKIQKKKRKREKSQGENVFAGRLFQECSGVPLTKAYYKNAQGKVKIYKTNRILTEKGNAYPLVQIKEETLLSCISSLLYGYLQLLSVNEKFYDGVVGSGGEKLQVLEKERRKLQQQINRWTETQMGNYEAWSNQTISRNQYIEQRNACLVKLKQLKGQREEIDRERERIERESEEHRNRRSDFFAVENAEKWIPCFVDRVYVGMDQQVTIIFYFSDVFK